MDISPFPCGCQSVCNRICQGILTKEMPKNQTQMSYFLSEC